MSSRINTAEAEPAAYRSARGDETQLFVDIEKTNTSIQEADNKMRNLMVGLDQDRIQIELDFETKKKEMNKSMAEIKVKKTHQPRPCFHKYCGCNF